MSVLELTDEQVVSLVKQLPGKAKRAAILSLAEDAAARRNERLEKGESEMRKLCTQRGLDWDRLSEDERETLINRLLHEK